MSLRSGRVTFEHEIQELTSNSDYTVTIDGVVYPRVRVLYKGGILEERDYMIGRLFLWWRIRRFVRRTIRGHRALLQMGVKAQ